jgi:hypothetical protein
MSRIQSIASAALMVAMGTSAPVFANGDKAPEPKTSTGRELTGPGAHHEEYTASPSDTLRPRRDTLLDSGNAVPGKRKKGVGAPVPGVDDKSSTRPGE